MTEAPDHDELGVDETETFSIDELVARSGVPARTIRYYQSERLLPIPRKRGREAIYTIGHLERLRLIGELRDRSLNLASIRELVANDNPGRTVANWLGVDATLSAPWSDDRPRILAQAELELVVGERRPGLIGDLQRFGYVEPVAGGSWHVPSPTLLDHALRLFDAGIDIELSGRLRDLMRKRLAKAVEEMVKLIVERVGAGFAGAATPEELAVALGALRPVARETSSVILAQEVERALRALVERGPHSASSPRRANQ